MTSSKSVPVSFRMTPETKELLALCAQHEHRSMASMVEYMVHTYADLLGAHRRGQSEARRLKSKRFSNSLFVVHFGLKRRRSPARP